MLKFDKLLNDDLYTTYKGTYNGLPSILKFFTEQSDNNNEFEVIEFLHSNSDNPEWYPIPYESYNSQEIENMEEIIPKYVLENHEPYKLIVYSYLEGDDIVKENLIKDDIDNLKDDIREHLEQIHKVGLIYGDIRLPNIIFSKIFNRYLLIDYGRTFSNDSSKYLESFTDKEYYNVVDKFMYDKNVIPVTFPPMLYMLEYGEDILTYEDELKSIDKLIN